MHALRRPGSLLAAVPILWAAVLAIPPGAHAQGTRLLRDPDVGPNHIVFVHANDLWLTPRSGGDALRLTSGDGAETDPVFSREENGPAEA